MTSAWIRPDLTLTGAHVRLIPLETSHAPALFRIGMDPEIWRYVPIPMRNSRDMAEYVAQAIAGRESGECFPFAVTDASNGRIIGSTRFYSLAPAHRNLEIGYTWLERARWRTAANSENKFMMLRHAFESLGCLRVALRTDIRNLRSQAAMERFGAVREGLFRKHMILPDGHIRDTVYYSVIDEEWPRVKAFFEARLAPLQA